MIYKPFHDLNLSTLGMGNMRLPTVGGERGSPIDEGKARPHLRPFLAGLLWENPPRPAPGAI